PDVNDARIALRHRDVVDAPAHARRADRAEPEAGEQRIVGLIDDRRIARASLALLRGAGRDEQRQDEQRQRNGQAAESMDVKPRQHGADSTRTQHLRVQLERSTGHSFLRNHVRKHLMQVLAWKPLPAHHDPDELFQVIDALKRVSFEEQEVGSLSDAERAELLVLAQKGGWRNSGRANRLVRCETALSQQFELALKRGARSDERQPHRIGASHETGTQKVARQNASARVAIDTSDACMRADTNAFVSRHSLAVSADRRTAATVMNPAIIAKAMRSATLSKSSPPG